MDLADLLEIQRDRLPHRTRPAVVYLENRWRELGAPAKCEALAEFLDGALKSCIYLGLLYPKVFLKRLKQVQRHEWMPRAQAAVEEKQVRWETSTAPNQRPDPDDDLMQRIREKERSGDGMDEEMRRLLGEKLRRSRERQRRHESREEWAQVGEIVKDLALGSSSRSQRSVRAKGGTR